MFTGLDHCFCGDYLVIALQKELTETVRAAETYHHGELE